MPNALTMDKLSRSLQRVLDSPELRRALGERLSDPDALWQTLGDQDLFADLALEGHEIEFLRTLPRSITEAIRAAAVAALEAGQRIDVLYVPSYDFTVQVWDYGEGLSLQLGAPYPPGSSRATYLGGETSA